MQPQGPELPNDVPNTPAPPTPPISTIGHDAAGIELGCGACASQALQLRDAAAPWPTWVKVLVGLSAIGVVGAVITLIVRAAR